VRPSQVATLLFALLGIYGAMAYTVQQREREIAIRVALGAPSRAVSGMFLRESVVVMAAGACLGLAGGVALGRTLESWLYGVPGDDVLTAAAASALLMAMGASAAWWPARRASRRSPLPALTDT
jgi:ABC-type antimicrobial peptide transport system permease subunit